MSLVKPRRQLPLSCFHLSLAQYPLAADKTTYTRYHLPFALYVPQPHERNELLTNRKMNDHPFDVHEGAAHYHFPRFYTRENQTKKRQSSQQKPT